jgi:hypothetical protein
LNGASNAVALAQQAKDISDTASSLHADFKASRAGKASGKAAAGTGAKASTPLKASTPGPGKASKAGGSSKGSSGGKKRSVEFDMAKLVAM